MKLSKQSNKESYKTPSRILKCNGIIFILKFAESLKEAKITKGEVILEPLVHLKPCLINQDTPKSKPNISVYELSIALYVPKELKVLGEEEKDLPFLDISDTDSRYSDNVIHFMYKSSPTEKRKGNKKTSVIESTDLNRREFIIKYDPVNEDPKDQEIIIHYLQIYYILTKDAIDLTPEAITISVVNGADGPDEDTTTRGTKTSAANSNN